MCHTPVSVLVEKLFCSTYIIGHIRQPPYTGVGIAFPDSLSVNRLQRPVEFSPHFPLRSIHLVRQALTAERLR